MKPKQIELTAGKVLIGNSDNRGDSSAYTLPLSSGSEGQVLTLGAGAAAAWSDAAGGGSSSYTKLTANIAASSFAVADYVAPYTNGGQVTINLPSTRYNLAASLALDGQFFKVVNKSTHNVFLTVADGHYYSSGTYYQTYMRNPNNMGQTGQGNDEPETFTIAPFTKYEVFCHIDYNTSSIKRLSYTIL